MSEGTHNIEVENAILGKLKINSPEMNNIITLFTFVMVVLISYVLWTHTNQAIAGDKATADALVQSNRLTAETLKESSAEMTRALQRLADSQERAARAQDKTNCLLAIPPDRRNQAEELCNRILRMR